MVAWIQERKDALGIGLEGWITKKDEVTFVGNECVMMLIVMVYSVHKSEKYLIVHLMGNLLYVNLYLNEGVKKVTV